MDFTRFTWPDHPKNPLILPRFPDWMIADPTVLPPSQTPDGRWHLFANAIIKGIQHFVSDDGVEWERIGTGLFLGIRPYVVLENGLYHLFYEMADFPRGSVIARRTSADLTHFSGPEIVARPEFEWEGKRLRTNGNPCLVRHGGRYALYFSAGWVFLKDCLFLEPRHIGVAWADRIEGPYVKHPTPLISPAPEPRFRNLGAGSMKVLPPDAPGAPWWAFNNGIFLDEQGRSRSEIHLLTSRDGLGWELASASPLLTFGDAGWKRALVYAMHVVEHDGEWRMYYNARDGWFIGKERIGLATARPTP